MYFKLSLRNVRKSFSDYALYFLTLTFGVCVFYVFNSIEAQKAMMHISSSAQQIMKTITWLMDGVSVFVSFILGFLIVYANNFLIRRRKREFGIYMTLGMEKGKISRILISETFIIGVFSLAAGLFAGVFLSQWLSVVTAKLFEASMAEYRFIFSLSALLKTILYFGIIFVIAIVTSTVVISKYKLIDLINSIKQNETPKIKNPAVTTVLFILSVLLIGTAYRLVLKNGIASFDRMLAFECVLGAAGTFLFFASLSGFFLGLFKANRSRYFSGLNMFIMRQINSRINTAHISMSFICLMLFVTIGIFSTGLGITKVLNKGFRDAAPFDVSLSVEKDADLSAILSEHGVKLSDYSDSFIQYKEYSFKDDSLTLGTVLSKVEDQIPPEGRDTVIKRMYPMPVKLIRLSDYNRLMELSGKPGLSLSGSQAALLTQYAWSEADLQSLLENYISQGSHLNIGGADYSVYPRLLTEGIVNNGYDIFVLVVPDEAVQKSAVSGSVLCFNMRADSVAAQDRFEDALMAKGIPARCVSKNSVLAQAAGSKAIISFVCIYVGIIFLITSAAVLALQQLSEAADNKHRYAILKKIGADNGLLSRTILKQIAIYFMIPLALACVHSIVGIKVANDAIRQIGSLNAALNIVITAAAILLIYGTYFVATYLGSKKIILRN